MANLRSARESGRWATGDQRGRSCRRGVERRHETGCRTRGNQRVPQAVANEIVDQRLLAEANLCFGGVNVYVHLFGRHFKEEQNHRRAGGRDDVPIRLGDGVQQKTIPNEPLVDEDVDGVAIELLQFRLGVKAGERAMMPGSRARLIGIALPWRRFGKTGAVKMRFGGDGKQLRKRLFAEDLVDALGGRLTGGAETSVCEADSSSKCFSGCASA